MDPLAVYDYLQTTRTRVFAGVRTLTDGQYAREFPIGTGTVGTFAGDGTAAHTDGIGAAAQIHRPRGLTSDGTSIYWVEFNQHTVRQGVLATASVTTMAGTAGTNGSTDATGTAATFDGPFSVVYHFPSQALYVVDSANSVIRRIQ